MSAAIAIATTASLLCASLDRVAFGKALARLKHLVPSRAPRPVLEAVLIESAGDHLSLIATDLTVFVRVVVPASVTSSGDLLVPLRRLVELTRNGARQLDLAGTTIALGAATHRLAVLDPSTFPVVPTPSGEVLATLLRPTLARALAATSYAMSTDETRPHLSALFVERRNGELRFVATDGHRLALARLPDDGHDFTLLVGRRTIEEVERLVAAPGGLVRVHRDGDRVWFVSGEEWVSGKVVDATFPFYEQVIPEHFAGRVTFPTKDLVEAVRAVAPKGTPGVRLALQRDAARVVLGVDDGDGNLTEATVAASFEGELPAALGINAQYLRELLRALVDEDRTVTIELNGELDPLRVDSAGETTAVVMPLRL